MVNIASARAARAPSSLRSSSGVGSGWRVVLELCTESAPWRRHRVCVQGNTPQPSVSSTRGLAEATGIWQRRKSSFTHSAPSTPPWWSWFRELGRWRVFWCFYITWDSISAPLCCWWRVRGLHLNTSHFLTNMVTFQVSPPESLIHYLYILLLSIFLLPHNEILWCLLCSTVYG